MVNPHISAANVSKYNFNHNDGDYTLTQATLALAYEQRTANLIEWRLAGKNRTGEGPAIDEQIRERLDLS